MTAMKTPQILALIMGVLIVGSIGTVYYYTQNQQAQNKERLDWKPKSIPKTNGMVYQPQIPGIASDQRSMGSYIGQAEFGSSRYGKWVSQYKEATMSSNEAWELAKSNPKFSEFLQNYPSFSNWTYFDGKYWWVEAYDTQNYENWALIMIWDEMKEITQVYIVQGDDVYLDWPTANLTADEVLAIANDDPIVNEFMTAVNGTLLDAWIWFDGNVTWFVDYYDFYILNEGIRSSGNDTEGDELGYTETVTAENPLGAPSSEEPIRVPYFNPYWMSIEINDDTASMSRIMTNFDNTSKLVNTAENVKQKIGQIQEFNDFNQSFPSNYLSLTLMWDYSSGEPKAYWLAESYAWTWKTFENVSSTVKKAEYWSFNYLMITIVDQNFSVSNSIKYLSDEQQIQTALDTILALPEIKNFTETYYENYMYMSYDPFNDEWWVSIDPTWTWLAYANVILDGDMSVKHMDVQTIPDNMMPNLTPSEVKALVMNDTIYQDFIANYSRYGSITVSIFYGSGNDFAIDNPRSGNVSDPSVSDPNAPSSGNGFPYQENIWTVYIWSDVISEASLFYIVLDENQTANLIYLTEPNMMPQHLPDEVLNAVSSLPEVVEFLNSTPEYEISISYYSYLDTGSGGGVWFIDYHTNDFSKFVSIEIDDVTLQVIEIYKYP